MIIYNIQVHEAQSKAFSEMLASLKQLGVIASYHVTKNDLKPTGDLTTDQLLKILEDSERQIESGLFIPSNKVVAFIRSKRQKNK
jgi:hypothetical protein